MADEQLPSRFSLLSQLWFRWTRLRRATVGQAEKCFELKISEAKPPQAIY